MPAILLNKQVDLQSLPFGKIGVWFSGASDYLDVTETTTDGVVLSNGVKVLGFVIHNVSDDNLVAHLLLRYDDANVEGGWVPALGKLGSTWLNPCNVSEVDGELPHKVAVMVFGNQAPIEQVVTDLLLS